MHKLILAAAVAAIAGPAAALDGIVEKQQFTLTDFTTEGGATIPEMTLGYETYGTLNEARDNAILITHFFSGNSHAAGKYVESDAAPGYWDAIIGPGKPIDTDKYFVVAADTPVNLGAKSPTVVTTGPATVNPATGKPSGMDFPIVTIGDFVETQKGLMDQLGIQKWRAVMGPSMGGLQAYDWAARYPDRLERVIPVIAAGWADANLIAWLDIWGSPVRLDANWNGGDYYEGTAPDAGLAQALKIVTLHAGSREWTDPTFGRDWAEDGADPADAMENEFAVVKTLNDGGAARAATSDANHLLYLIRANQLFVAGGKGGAGGADGGGESPYRGLLAIDVPVMIVHTDEDEVFPGDAVRETASIIRSDGTPVEVVEINGTRGHLDGIVNIAQAGEQIRGFLDREID